MSTLRFSEAFENARDAAAHGFAVLPVYGVIDGACCCGNPACANPGKHPLIARGFHDASSDEAQLLPWNDRWPDANWALACGSRVSVIDIDSKAGADPAEIVADYELAGRPQVRTGEALDSGIRGAHVYCQNGVPTGRTAAAGVEIRANGAYVLLPGSRHISGVSYEWHEEARPWTEALLPVPQILVPRRAGSGQRAPYDPDVRVPHGERHDHLKDFAVRLVRAGVTSDGLILAHLRTQFHEACEQEPAPDAGSIEALAKWAAGSDIADRERERKQVSTDAKVLLKDASSILGTDPEDPLIHAWRQSEHPDTPLSARTEGGTTLRWERQADMIKPDSLVLPVLAVKGLPGPEKLPLTKPLAMRAYKLLVDATETLERLDAREEAREWIEGFERRGAARSAFRGRRVQVSRGGGHEELPACRCSDDTLERPSGAR